MLDVTQSVEEVLVVEQELIADDHTDHDEEETVAASDDDLMPRSSPDGSTDIDIDDEQQGNTCLLTCLLTYLLSLLSVTENSQAADRAD